MLGNLLIDFSKKTSFWDIPKWNIRQTNWDKESTTLEQISDYSRLSFTFLGSPFFVIRFAKFRTFKSSP